MCSSKWLDFQIYCPDAHHRGLRNDPANCCRALQRGWVAVSLRIILYINCYNAQTLVLYELNFHFPPKFPNNFPVDVHHVFLVLSDHKTAVKRGAVPPLHVRGGQERSLWSFLWQFGRKIRDSKFQSAVLSEPSAVIPSCFPMFGLT